MSAPPISIGLVAPHSAAASDPSKPKPEIARAAREFEAIFIRKMLTSLEKAGQIGKSGALSSGGDVYSSMMVGAVADAVANAGGIGLASYITKSLSPAEPTSHPLHPPDQAPIPLTRSAPGMPIEAKPSESPKGVSGLTVHSER